MKIKRLVSLILISFIGIALISGIFISLRVKTLVKELFKMNKDLQEEGYYMAGFEFQMLGFGYYLDKGQYVKALAKLSDYHRKLSNRDELIKIPEFMNNQEEIDFYLNLQNPETGAFMDDSAPFCTYFSVTENIICHLDALADSTTTPVKLKYPLTFLDEINTPKNLKTYLNDISYVGWLASKFPQTTFHFARDILSNAEPDNVIERNSLYSFTPEWKHTMLQWMHEFQDSITGLWGPKNKKTNELIKFDINNTYSILKIYIDTNGDDIHEDFPLRYQEKLINSVLEQLSEPMPDDEGLAEVHEWNLQQTKGIKMLLSRLWKDASEENKDLAKKIITNFVEVSFDKYYVEKDGAFSYYPNAEHATIDGMSNMILKTTGALSYNKQKKYWGDPVKNAVDLGVVAVNEITVNDLDTITNIPDINSLRIYTAKPNFKALTDNVWAVVYPYTTKVLDITELVPNIITWTGSSSLSIGNWKSRADIKNQYSSINIKKPLIYREEFPYSEVNNKLKISSEIYIIGFDILQIPRFIVKYKKEKK